MLSFGSIRLDGGLFSFIVTEFLLGGISLSHFCLLSLLEMGSNNHYKLGTDLEFSPKSFLGSFYVNFSLSTSLHYCCKEEKVQIIGAKTSVFQILMHGLTHVPYFLHMLDHPF